MARSKKIHFIVIQSLNDGETIVCLPKDLKRIKRLFFKKDTGRDAKEFVFYNVYEDNVWLQTSRPSLESYHDERDE